MCATRTDSDTNFISKNSKLSIYRDFFFFSQIENQDDGIRIIHILGIEHRHSGEVQCLAYNTLNPSATQRSSYTELAVLPRPIQLTNLDGDISDAVPPFEANAANDTANEAITNATTSAVAQQTFKQIADVPAYLIRGPDDCIALIGGNVSLTVTYGGYPKPTIKWLRAVSIQYFEFNSFNFPVRGVCVSAVFGGLSRNKIDSRVPQNIIVPARLLHFHEQSINK